MPGVFMLGIDDAIAAVSNLADSAVKRIWPDATEIEKAKIAQLTQEMQNQFNLVLGQLEINKVEAGSASWLTSGWRPYVGWVCGTALAYSTIVEPILRFISVVMFGYAGSFPIINTDLTEQILIGMLGFGVARSLDKYLGTARK
jgi:hypothetical protein